MDTHLNLNLIVRSEVGIASAMTQVDQVDTPPRSMVTEEPFWQSQLCWKPPIFQPYSAVQKIFFRFHGFRPNCEIDIFITKASVEIFLRWL